MKRFSTNLDCATHNQQGTSAADRSVIGQISPPSPSRATTSQSLPEEVLGRHKVHGLCPAFVCTFVHVCEYEFYFFLSPQSHSDTSHLCIIIRSLYDISKWLVLGLELGMDYSLLDDIDRDKGGDMERCKAAMLHAWLQSGRATKSSLVHALGRIGEDDIAAKIVGD